MTRDEHLQWAKDRALEYARRGDLVNAFASLGSDLLKHKELNTPTTSFLMSVGVTHVSNQDVPGMIRFIEGFH